MGQAVFETTATTYVSPDDYLRLECESIEKHEYFYGEIRAMAGASYAHNRICANMTVAIGSQLRGKSCSVVGSDQRLQILSGSAYMYPDVTVVCGKPEFNESRKPETLLNPTLLVEVLSESTADKDRSEKFMLYRQLPSLQQYLMLDSRTCHAELYTRQPNDYWLFMETRDPAAVLDLSSIACQVLLAEVYQGMQP